MVLYKYSMVYNSLPRNIIVLPSFLYFLQAMWSLGRKDMSAHLNYIYCKVKAWIQAWISSYAWNMMINFIILLNKHDLSLSLLMVTQRHVYFSFQYMSLHVLIIFIFIFSILGPSCVHFYFYFSIPLHLKNIGVFLGGNKRHVFAYF